MLLAVAPPPLPFVAKVVKIIDGDTIKVLVFGTIQEITVRTACIDAPESNQFGGKQSAINLRTLLPVGTVVQVIPTGENDRYNRSIGIIFNGEVNINLQQVQTGNAQVYPQYLSSCGQYSEALLTAEAQAKQNLLGIWGNPAHCSPWEWRFNKCTVSPECKPADNL
jgi:endonuclease YncB( thermonuclease family)